MAGRIEPRDAAESLGLRFLDTGPELELPQHRQGAPLGVVVQAHQVHARGLPRLGRWRDALDQILPLPHPHDGADARGQGIEGASSEHGRGRRAVGGPRVFE